MEQFITSSDFCGQFLDAQFFVALLSLQRSLQKSWNAILQVGGGGSAYFVTRGNKLPRKKSPSKKVSLPQSPTESQQFICFRLGVSGLPPPLLAGC